MSDIVGRLHSRMWDSLIQTQTAREAAAEIERLRGEASYMTDEVVPALRAEIELLTRRWNDYRIAHDSAAKDNERLEADNERLRALLRKWSLLHRWVAACAEETHDVWIESENAIAGEKSGRKDDQGLPGLKKSSA